MVEIQWDKITSKGASVILHEYEKIPLYDTKGGRQRTSKENETIIRLKIFLENHTD